MNSKTSENKLSKIKNALIILSEVITETEELANLRQNFCGQVYDDIPKATEQFNHVYICGDLSKLTQINPSYNVIKELSLHYNNLNNPKVSLGQVPIILYNAGVYFRQLFDEKKLFHKVESEHEFQQLTESNKASKAFRKGIYLTKITQNASELNFRLLRCSSNLSGATDNFRTTDKLIVSKVNQLAHSVFEQSTDLNHVLAQIYYNHKGDNNKETKAKIKAHSDKTKDMPKEGLIAFCTFYNEDEFQELNQSSKDRFDWCYKNNSGLTRLLFKRKTDVGDDTLVDSFSVTLYPNSVFIIPLSTNRLYTHEIRPSMLNIDRVPTRMGYVIRCSNLEAVYKNEQTYIKENEQWIPLAPMTAKNQQALKENYFIENSEINHVNYGEVSFSMNEGDYKKPIY